MCLFKNVGHVNPFRLGHIARSWPSSRKLLLLAGLATQRDVTQEARQWRMKCTGWSPLCLQNDRDWTSQRILHQKNMMVTSIVSQERPSYLQVGENSRINFLFSLKVISILAGPTSRWTQDGGCARTNKPIFSVLSCVCGRFYFFW